jgi:hypothetical protein
VGIQQAEQIAATPAEVALETDLVKLALRAAEHHPILKAVYAGPLEWLEEAQRDPGDPAALVVAANDLSARAEAAGHRYVAGQARSVAVQLDLHLGRALPYDRMVSALLGVELVAPSGEEVGALQAEIVEEASRLAPSGAADPVRAWERDRLISGEDKWDAAMHAYLAGRRYARRTFPLQVAEGVDIIRITDQLWSVNLSWYPPRRMTFEVNLASPRTPEAVWFEVAHNIYPGDYLHLAVLHQHTYARRGHIAAAIKLKNAPESVISEGIEETALLRMIDEPTAEQVLASKLEWLRRIATLRGAIALNIDGRDEPAVLESMERDGFMDEDRARFQLGFVKHPLWGPYQYTYILGRKLVEEADRRVSARNRNAYLDYLYSGLHTPQTFMEGLGKALGE